MRTLAGVASSSNRAYQNRTTPLTSDEVVAVVANVATPGRNADPGVAALGHLTDGVAASSVGDGTGVVGLVVDPDDVTVRRHRVQVVSPAATDVGSPAVEIGVGEIRRSAPARATSRASKTVSEKAALPPAQPSSQAVTASAHPQDLSAN
jgi:hypothetical protein